MRRWKLIPCLLGVLLPAAASSETVVLVAETSNARIALGDFIDQLGESEKRSGLIFGQTLRRRIEAEHSWALSRSSDSIQTFVEDVEDMRRLFIEGAYAQALQRADMLRRKARNNLAAVAKNQRFYDAWRELLSQRAHVLLRLEHRQQAKEELAEVRRTFLLQKMSLIRHGPELNALYQEVVDELEQQGKGTLKIEATVQPCRAFVNENEIGYTPVALRQLLAGTYRVFVLCGRDLQQSRVHLAGVAAGQNTVIQIDPEMDAALRSKPRPAIRLAEERRADSRSLRYAIDLATDLRAGQLILFETRHGGATEEGSPQVSILGRRIDLRSRRLLAAEEILCNAENLEDSQASFQKLFAQLQQRVSGGSAVPITTGGDLALLETQLQPSVVEDPSLGWQVAKWSTLVGSVALAGASAAMFALHGSGTCTEEICPREYNTQPLGVTFAVLGGGAAIASALLFALE